MRNNTNRYKGFLTDDDRLNVAITCARRGMIIVENVECLGRPAKGENCSWAKLVRDHYGNDAIQEGDSEQPALKQRKVNTNKKIRNDHLKTRRMNQEGTPRTGGEL